MATCIVTFRLHDDLAASARWTSIMNRIRGEAIGATWEETTSFVLLKSDKSAKALAEAIFREAAMSSLDKLVVINLDDRTHYPVGAVDDRQLLSSFFPTNALLGALLGMATR